MRGFYSILPTLSPDFSGVCAAIAVATAWNELIPPPCEPPRSEKPPNSCFKPFQRYL